MTKPTQTPRKLDKTALRALRAQLKRLHKIYSWRNMSKEIYQGEVSHSVLQRLATEKGYIPADEKILEALDLFRKPNPYRILPRWFHRTPEALAYVNRKREQVKHLGAETRKAAKR